MGATVFDRAERVRVVRATENDLPWTGIMCSAALIEALRDDAELDVEETVPSGDRPYWREGT
ncbi:hypothetical protein [Nocardia sp. NPDC004260]